MLLRRMSKKYFAMYSWLNEELTKLVRMEWQRKNFLLDSNNCILYNKCNINDTKKSRIDNSAQWIRIIPTQHNKIITKQILKNNSWECVTTLAARTGDNCVGCWSENRIRYVTRTRSRTEQENIYGRIIFRVTTPRVIQDANKNTGRLIKNCLIATERVR